LIGIILGDFDHSETQAKGRRGLRVFFGADYQRLVVKSVSQSET
jgi:hypothetical protein